MTLAENLRVAREAAGLSQPELARRVGCRQTLISQLEKGTNQTTKLIYKIAEALGTQAHKLDPRIPSPTGDEELDDWMAIYVTFPARARHSFKDAVKHLKEVYEAADRNESVTADTSPLPDDQ